MTLVRPMLVALLAIAQPVAAQVPVPPAPHHNDFDQRGRGRMFEGMTDAGRARMIEAMRSADPRASRAAVKAARDQILTVLDAERLDTTALKRAMDAERAAADGAKVRRQEALLQAYQSLSAADRKALVADARAMRTRVEARMMERHARREARRDARRDGPLPMPPQ